MARPAKATVDYFPHVCKTGKTVHILERYYKNDGYAVWFKTLQQLGMSENHYIDCRDEMTWEYLISFCNVEEETLKAILDKCAKLNAIDRELWQERIIFSQNFVDGLKEVYDKRTVDIPDKEKIINLLFPDRKPQKSEVSVPETIENNSIGGINPQREEEESKVKKPEEEEILSSSGLKNFSQDKSGFVQRVRDSKKLKEQIKACMPSDSELEVFYEYLKTKKPEKLIHQALNSYLSKKILKFEVNEDFQSDFKNWLDKEKELEKPLNPVQAKGPVYPPFVKPDYGERFDHLSLPREKALDFCRKIPKSGKFYKELVEKWKFSEDEL